MHNPFMPKETPFVNDGQASIDQVAMNASRENLPAYLAAASEVVGVSVEVLPVDTEEQAAAAAARLESVERQRVQRAGRSYGRIAGAAMADHLFEQRDRIAPVVITKTGISDLSAYWRRVEAHKDKPQA
ncbi:MAG: hypothetical protein JWM81_560 [Candidatus Saccharibacteria bacterium]|nr:hypothetical protein [Candidatus Saccharibacteria bacterium]